MTAARLWLAIVFCPVAIAGLGRAEAASTDMGMPPVMDDQIWAHAILNQFEDRSSGSQNNFKLDAQGWAGTDAEKIWARTEGEIGTDGRYQDGRDELLYDRPISSYFDMQAGIRYDLDSGPGRGWGAAGIQGLAPYFFDVEATAYVSDAGHLAARFEASYDLLITQRLILQPEIELNLYSKNDARRGIGSGLSDLDAGLRLRYEIYRKFAPYIGIVDQERFGTTGDYTRVTGGSASDLRIVFGLRAWL